MQSLNRRQFKRTAAALLASGLMNTAFVGNEPSQTKQKKPRTKKGICGEGLRCQAVDASWYYNWVTSPSGKFDGQNEVEFVPMFKHGWDVTKKNLNKVEALKTSHNVSHVLGFNEPDSKKQGNVTVKKALELWPKLVELDLRLGSPAVTDNARGKAWFNQFMQQAKRRKFKIDFICLHLYPNIKNQNSVNQFVRKIAHMHEAYKLPIWITEFSLLNFGSKDRNMTALDNLKFMKLVLPYLNKLNYVERYSWFSGNIAAMFKGPVKENNLTQLGKQYKSL